MSLITERAPVGRAEPARRVAELSVAGRVAEMSLAARAAARGISVARLALAAAAVWLFTAPIDLMPVATVQGMPIRPGLLAVILAGSVAGIALLRGGNLGRSWPVGTPFLVGIALWNVVATLMAGPDARGYGYMVLAFILVAGATLVGTLPRSGVPAPRLIAVFRWSLVAMAAFGVLQFVLDNFAVPMFVQQHWPSGVPRINGLSSEPSYYATYMLPALPLCHSRARSGHRVWHLGTALVVLAIVLSNSRIGMLATALWWAIQFVATPGGLTARLRSMGPAALAILLGLTVEIGVPLIRSYDPGVTRSGPRSTGTGSRLQAGVSLQHAAIQLFEGTGVHGTNSESRDARIKGLKATATVAREHLVAGVGIGHVRREAVRITGHPYSSVINVTFELLGGIGLIGFVLLLGWAFAVGAPLWALIRAGGAQGRAAADLCVGLGLMGLALQANQNALRLPVWALIALLLALLSDVSRLRLSAAPRTREAHAAE